MPIFGKGKCKLIANFSATMVTSLPSISLSLSLSVSLSLSLSLSHQKYLTHNIGSASALPIMCWKNKGQDRVSVSVYSVCLGMSTMCWKNKGQHRVSVSVHTVCLGMKNNVLEEQRSGPSECECVLCVSGYEYNVLEEQRSAPSECECVLCVSGCECGYHCKTKQSTCTHRVFGTCVLRMSGYEYKLHTVRLSVCLGMSTVYSNIICMILL